MSFDNHNLKFIGLELSSVDSYSNSGNFYILINNCQGNIENKPASSFSVARQVTFAIQTLAGELLLNTPRDNSGRHLDSQVYFGVGWGVDTKCYFYGKERLQPFQGFSLNSCPGKHLSKEKGIILL